MFASIGWAIARFVAVLVINYFVSQALTRKSGNNNAEAASQSDWDFPQTDEGTPQCVFFGDCWTEDWQVLAYGNYRTSEIRRS